MSDKNTSISILKEKVARFNRERDWKQFHSPKNLAISISVEAAELLELFQWTDKSLIETMNDKELMEKIKEEIADISIYIFDLVNTLNLDISRAILDKLNQNAKKYPVDKCKGKAAKYHEYARK